MDTNDATRKAARTAIRKIAGTFNVDIIDMLFATVESVDITKRTCTVKPISGKSDTPIEDVLLTIDQNDGEIKVPSVGSTVGVAMSNDLEPFLFAWSDLDKIIWKGGDYGGLTKTLELQLQLDKLDAQLQAVIGSLTNWTPVPNDGGAALKTFFTTQIAGKTQADFSNIENNLMNHGSK